MLFCTFAELESPGIARSVQLGGSGSAEEALKRLDADQPASVDHYRVQPAGGYQFINFTPAQSRKPTRLGHRDGDPLVLGVPVKPGSSGAVLQQAPLSVHGCNRTWLSIRRDAGA